MRRCDHITPILHQLHWLPVRQRVLFKIAVLAFQWLAGQAPSYLSDDCQPVSDSRPRRLRSSDSLTCAVRRAHNTYGDLCYCGPRVWNFFAAELQSCDSLSSDSALADHCARLQIIFTYLLTYNWLINAVHRHSSWPWRPLMSPLSTIVVSLVSV